MSHINPASEIWKPVIGHEKTYQVSSCGRVRSHTREITFTRNGGEVTRICKGKMLKASLAPCGYLRVSLCDGLAYVHHLVLEAFVGPRPDGMLGLRYDDDPENCTIGNLRWGTFSENAEDAKRNGIRLGPPIGNTNAKRS